MVLKKSPRSIVLVVISAVTAAILLLVLYEVQRRAGADRGQTSIQHSKGNRVEATSAPLDENSGEVKASLPLFHRMSPEYSRGAEPAMGGVDVLARMGFKAIVDLRSKYDRTPRVAAEAGRVGLRYYWLPLSVWDPPSDKETAEFLSMVSDPANTPVFVFCADGVNRTGEMTAIYRVDHDGLTTEQAIKEMDDLGFSPYYYSLRSYVWDFTREHHPLAVSEPAEPNRASGTTSRSGQSPAPR